MAGRSFAFNQPSPGGGMTPVQRAIQILSLRLPKRVGAGAITSPELLAGGGGPSALGTATTGAIPLQILRQLLMGGVPPAPAQMPPQAMAGTTMAPSLMGAQGFQGTLGAGWGGMPAAKQPWAMPMPSRAQLPRITPATPPGGPQLPVTRSPNVYTDESGPPTQWSPDVPMDLGTWLGRRRPSAGGVLGGQAVPKYR